ncbi:MAG: NUDIX hydrolase [Polaribacter sp.]
MYKVFLNDKPIILTSSSKKENTFPVYIFENIVFDEILYKLKYEKIKGINLYSNNLEADWQLFLTNFNVIQAAGGLVQNEKKEFLFIHRNNIWDLPKGKIEEGESPKTAAIREVEEECGIFKLTIISFLCTTYHIYYQKGIKLKETHWFLMRSNYKKTLVPQQEEGITEVLFKNPLETKEALKKSHRNINLVYNTFLEM